VSTEASNQDPGTRESSLKPPRGDKSLIARRLVEYGA